MGDTSRDQDRPLTPSARFALYGAGAEPGAALPEARAYPREYVDRIMLADGSAVLLRPIRPDDEPLMVRFHQELGEESVLLRYAGTFELHRRIDHQRLAARCRIDYDREMAIVAEGRDADERPQLLGIGRLIMTSDRAAEFGLVVLDRAQGKGLGTELLARLLQFGRDEGLERVDADILARNHAMQRVARKHGFDIIYPPELDDPMVRATLRLE